MVTLRNCIPLTSGFRPSIHTVTLSYLCSSLKGTASSQFSPPLLFLWHHYFPFLRIRSVHSTGHGFWEALRPAGIRFPSRYPWKSVWDEEDWNHSLSREEWNPPHHVSVLIYQELKTEMVRRLLLRSTLQAAKAVLPLVQSLPKAHADSSYRVLLQVVHRRKTLTVLLTVRWERKSIYLSIHLSLYFSLL